MTLKNIIKKMPYCIQKPIKEMWNLIPYNIKLGREFKDTYNFLQKSQWWTKEQHEEYQMRQLEKLLKHAYENVEYYRKVFDERGLKPKDIQNFYDLKQLPYLTKEIIENNLSSLIAKNYSKRMLKYVTTGGSTGLPLGFYVDKHIGNAREWAFITNQWSRVGYDIHGKNKCVILRGDIPLRGVYEYTGGNLILSSFQLTEENMKEYIKMIENFNPDFIQAYPSSISILVDFILENNIKLKINNLKAVLCASENLYDFQRKKINEVFKVRVYSFYGHTEHCCLGGECEKSSYYHLFSEYGYTEIINENGEDVKEENEMGEIVATGFNNYVIPFIRYRTGDIAVNTNEECECGRKYKLIKRVQGRVQEFFIDEKENLVIFTWADEPIWHVKHKIKAYQYVQNELGKVILNIECKDKLIDIEINQIKEEFLKYYPNFSIEINEVEHIKRTGRGKFKYLIQTIPIKLI